MAEVNIVKNASEGYGYKYSSLADLAKANIKIPKMRVKADDYGEFIEYYDEATKQWQQGARVVTFEAKNMNAAQAYGAALTYARRYTVQLAEAVACDDDDAVEKAKPISPAAKQKTLAGGAPTEKQLGFLRKLLKEAGKTESEIDGIVKMCKTSAMASKWIEKAKELPKASEEVLPTEEEVA